MKVDYCERSTITEAWVTLLGPPGPFVNDGPLRALEYLVKPKFPELQQEPTMVIASSGAEVAPFWLSQWRLGPNHRVRLAHRFVSVHFVREHGDATRYET